MCRRIVRCRGKGKGRRPSDVGARRDRGQSAVEFALVLPMALTIIIGVVDLGRAVYYYNSLSSLAREGARAGIVLQYQSDWQIPGNSRGTYSGIGSYAGTNTIVGRVASEAVIFDLSKTTVDVQTPMGTNRFQSLPLAVSVQYPFTMLYANWIASSPTITMTAQATMRIE